MGLKADPDLKPPADYFTKEGRQKLCDEAERIARMFYAANPWGAKNTDGSRADTLEIPIAWSQAEHGHMHVVVVIPRVKGDSTDLIDVEALVLAALSALSVQFFAVYG